MQFPQNRFLIRQTQQTALIFQMILIADKCRRTQLAVVFGQEVLVMIAIKLYIVGDLYCVFNFAGNPAQDHKIQSESSNVILYTDTTISLDNAVEADFFPLFGYVKIKGRINADLLPPATPDGDYDTIEEYMYYNRAAGSPILNIVERNVFGSNAANADFIMADPMDPTVTF